MEEGQLLLRGEVGCLLWMEYKKTKRPRGYRKLQKTNQAGDWRLADWFWRGELVSLVLILEVIDDLTPTNSDAVYRL